MTNTLTATKRSKTDKLTTIRANGMVPAVVYGAQVENTPISVQGVDFLKVLKTAGETSTILLDLGSKKVDVLVHDIQFDPVKGNPIHVDFLAIDMNKPVEIKVPIEFIGIAPAEKNGLGVLVKTMHELEIESLPKDIPSHIEVDLSSLVDLESQIHVSDIKISGSIKILTDAGEVIASITSIKEEEEEPAGEVDLSKIEVEKKGKKDEEGEGEPDNK